jgi:hypothetical protein
MKNNSSLGSTDPLLGALVPMVPEYDALCLLSSSCKIYLYMMTYSFSYVTII